ncbi:hypothetical protein HDU92_004953 [Lobulomyces angularis]|nr:hypothetical protein HDU92_004953 [Lobulomyces angularis]
MAHPLDEQYLKNVKTELKVLESDNYGKVTLKSFMELLVSSLEERIGTTVAIDENIASSTSIYDFVTACKNGINLINNANQEFSEMYENNCEVQLDWHKITEEPLKHEIFVNLNVEMFEKFFDVVLLLEKEIFDVEKVSKIELAEKLNENEITQNSV